MSASTPITKMVRVSRNGRITIPAEFRRLLAVNEDTMYQVTLADGELFIKPVQGQRKGQEPAARAPQVRVRSD